MTLAIASYLRADIEQSRKRGYFLNQEESVEDATTVSARFRWNGADYIVTISGPTSRMKPKLDQAAKLAVEACLVLSGETS